jgi:beta-galactosidase
MVNLFDWHLKEQEQMPTLTGAAQWVFKDFSTPLRPENPVPRVNQKGLLERDGTPKESYYLYQSYWSETPMVHIHGHGWPVRWGRSDEEKLVKVFSNCPAVELFVNGVSAGVRRRDSADYPAAGLRWSVRLREGGNTLRAVARLNGSHRELVDELQLDYQVASWTAPVSLRLLGVGRSGDRVTIEARAFDATGVPCLDAVNQVRFGVTGDAKLIDNLGTSTGSRVVQLYNGRARIDVQLAGASANAVASVSGVGLATSLLPLATAP